MTMDHAQTQATDRLDFAYFEQTAQKLLYSTVGYPVTTTRCALGDSEIEQVEQLRDRFLGFAQRLFDYSLRNARVRRQHQMTFQHYDYKIISLGTDCLSRTIPTRWGLKPPKLMGERTHPFDLALHPYEALCRILDSDFRDYLDPNLLIMAGRNYVVHRTLKVQFNHEIGDEYAADGFAAFLDLYNRRIRNFREDTANHKILFILHMVSNHIPVELCEILQKWMPHTDWRLLAINTSDRAYGLASPGTTPPGLILAHIPYPYEGYVWHLLPHFTTAGGEAFDAKVVETVRQAIVDNFHPRDRKATANT
jgi:hypothetical protein